jgi:hypothetical protein
MGLQRRQHGGKGGRSVQGAGSQPPSVDRDVGEADLLDDSAGLGVGRAPF